MKIGLMGGMFDPIHLGHLNAANQAAELVGLKKVYFIPTAVAPHKKGAHATPTQRMEMVRLAIENNPLFDVSDIEIKKRKPSFTVDTLRDFAKRHIGDLYFILGMDAFEEIHYWKSARELFDLCNFIVISRPGSNTASAMERLEDNFRRKKTDFGFRKLGRTPGTQKFRVEGSEKRIYISSSTELDISSSLIREKIREGKSIKYLIPESVDSYIINVGIYQ